MSLKEDKEKLEGMIKEREKYAKAKDKYFEVTFAIEKLEKSVREREREESLRRIKRETAYIECEYPEMGVPGSNGSALFTSKHMADLLIDSLRSNAWGYGHFYDLEWDGVGRYDVIPSHDRDRDGDDTYTATFKRSEYQDEEV